MIDDRHVEWRVVSRLGELLERPPDTDHDVTLTYSLFTAILCWTCQRMRDRDRKLSAWDQLQREQAKDQPWGVHGLDPHEIVKGRACLDTLPGNSFLVGLRNAAAHGDDRLVRPYHKCLAGRADHMLDGFVFNATFYGPKQHPPTDCPPKWGGWRLTLKKADMRRIGLALAKHFCNGFDNDVQVDAEQHILLDDQVR